MLDLVFGSGQESGGKVNGGSGLQVKWCTNRYSDRAGKDTVGAIAAPPMGANYQQSIRATIVSTYSEDRYLTFIYVSNSK